MKVPQEFADRLAALDADELRVGGGHTSIAQSLRQVGAAAIRAVPSCRALSVTVSPGGVSCTVVLEHQDGKAPIASSLRLPIPVDEEQTAELVLYAATPGAFDLLANLLRDGVGRSVPVLDRDLVLPAETRTGLATQLDDLSVISRATGILIGRGLTPEAARAVLEEEAVRTDANLATAARRLLAEASAVG